MAVMTARATPTMRGSRHSLHREWLLEPLSPTLSPMGRGGAVLSRTFIPFPRWGEGVPCSPEPSSGHAQAQHGPQRTADLTLRDLGRAGDPVLELDRHLDHRVAEA